MHSYIDPFEQAEDWFNAIDWLAGEPMADMYGRGLLGSSYSGGHVVYVAQPRLEGRAIVSQLPGIASQPDANAAETPFVSAARDRAIRMARATSGTTPAPRGPAKGAQR